MSRIGVFGGTFDPPHVGHLIIAEQACGQLNLDKILFVPAHIPPHKKAGASASPRQRFAMVQKAIAHSSNFDVTSLELRRKGISYTIDTLEELHVLYTNAKLYLIVGGDNFAGFTTWKSVDDILNQATIVVYKRNWDTRVLKSGKSGRVIHLDGAALDISSTMIRDRVRRGESIRFLVPSVVEKYIQRNKLYRGKR